MKTYKVSEQNLKSLREFADLQIELVSEGESRANGDAHYFCGWLHQTVKTMHATIHNFANKLEESTADAPTPTV